MICAGYQTRNTRCVFSLGGAPSSGYAERSCDAKGVQHWKKFFANHKDYPQVGKVSHRPIDPASPIPEHCDPKKQAKVDEARREEAAREAKAKGEEPTHKKSEDEL
jgi:hypothetical protein